MNETKINDFIKYFKNSVFHKGNENLTINHVSTDSRECGPNQVFLALVGEKFDAHDFIPDVIKLNCSVIIINKEKILSVEDYINEETWVLCVDDTLRAYHEIAHSYLKTMPNLIKIGVTGSSGKTTVKEIIKSLLSTKYKVYANKGNFNNRFGVPRTALEITSDIEVAIFEMGMGEPNDIEKYAWIVRPNIACITSISEAHIGYFESLEQIARTKKGIFKYFNHECYAVVNENEKLYSILVQGVKGKIITINKIKSKKIKVIDNLGLNGYLLKVRDKKVRFTLGGGHNVTNLHFGLSIAEILNLNTEQIIKGIENVKLPGMRNQIKHGKYTVILDCYNANPDSMISALTHFNEIPLKDKINLKKIVVLADMLELGNKSVELHKSVGEYIASNCQNINYLFTTGTYGRYISEHAVSSGFDKTAASYLRDKIELLEKLKSLIKKGDFILFKASRGMKLEEIAEKLL